VKLLRIVLSAILSATILAACGGSNGINPATDIDGNQPAADLIYYNGELHGTTYQGGGTGCSGNGCGTIFEIVP
jgi:hypothetical protein